MKNTTSVRAVHTRLLNLAEKAHDFANAWHCGYSLSRGHWDTRADQCFRLHCHFERKANRLTVLASAALRGHMAKEMRRLAPQLSDLKTAV